MSSDLRKSRREGGHRLYPRRDFLLPLRDAGGYAKFYRGIYPTFDDQLFDKLYDVFQLPKRTPIRRFSKGMQKQAAFHLTVCTRPRTLILDEPVDGLDPVMRRQVMVSFSPTWRGTAQRC